MGEPITMTDAGLQVPDQPILPFIEGDGIGPDIWAAAVRVFDAAVEKAYGGKRMIDWLEVLAGEKAHGKTGEWLPEETIDSFREYLVGIKGPLTTPVGGGIRSLNVALRQRLDLYTCVRPVRWFEGVPSPVKRPDLTNMVIFRENTEDIYAGIEFQHGAEDNTKFKALIAESFPEHYKKIRFPDTVGLGIKPISQEGTDRIVRARRSSTRSTTSSPQRHARPQGEHHEVHRGRRSATGATSWPRPSLEEPSSTVGPGRPSAATGTRC